MAESAPLTKARWTARRGLYSVRVVYQDTDQARVVHHATYFRYLEAARIEFWRENGFNYDAFEKTTGLGLPVAETRMRYRASARFDDLVEVVTWPSAVTRASVWFDAEARRASDKLVLVESKVRLACASFGDGQIRRIPSGLLDACLEPGYDV